MGEFKAKLPLLSIMSFSVFGRIVFAMCRLLGVRTWSLLRLTKL